MANETKNPQDECLKALRELSQVGQEFYFSQNTVTYKIHKNGLDLGSGTVRDNLEYFVQTGDALRVIMPRGWQALTENPNDKAIYAYRAVDKPVDPPAIMSFDGDSTPDPKFCNS